MTLLHTKGYSEVLESVKMRAQKKAVAIARAPLIVAMREVLRRQESLAVEQVTLAREEYDAALPSGMFMPTSAEFDDLHLTFCWRFLLHYMDELEQIRSEKVAAEEMAEAEA